MRALANREYPEVNHPEVTREKGGKSVTESPTAVRIHIWILRDRETASGGNRIATHARPPIWHIGFRHCIVAGFLVRECRPKAMSSQRGRKARAGLRTDLGRDSDSDNGDSDYESSNEDSYVPRSTRGGTQVPRGSQSSLMRRGRPKTAVSGCQLLMLDVPSTGTGCLRRLALTYSVTVGR